MSWSLHGIKNASVGEAHEVLLKAYAPEPIKQYVRAGISGLVAVYGDGVRVTVSGHGHVCEGPGSYDVTSATVDVRKGEAAAKLEDAPTETALTVEQLIDRHYRHNRSDHLVEALKRIAGRNQA